MQRLEQQLSAHIKLTGDELLASALVPALEDYKSPARLIALTRSALLVIEDTMSKSRRLPKEQTESIYRYDLANVSSAQLRHSLLGSGLSIFMPQPGGQTQRLSFPFHSPAIPCFLPLFTRLRLLLSEPYRKHLSYREDYINGTNR